MFGIFLEKPNLFELAKILRNQFGNKFRNNFLFLGQKTLFWVKKFGNPCFGVKNRGFRTLGIYGKFGICSIPKFPNVRKTLFPNFFQTFSKLFPNFFQTFSKLFPNFFQTF